MRYAAVTNARDAAQVAAYLPANYEVYGHRFPEGPSRPMVVLIRGIDDAGWSMDDYVIPRLASGLLWAKEIIDLSIHFSRDDFEPILEAAGIYPDSVTAYEWSKFTDSFLEGTHWGEVAGYACDTILAMRKESNA